MAEDSGSLVKIKPSLVPFTWKGFALVLLGFIVYVAVSATQSRLESISPVYVPVSILDLVSLGLVGLGFLAILVGLVRRNMLTYTLTGVEIVVQRQLFGRSVRRIPLASLSDVQVSQTLIGRIAGYGNIAPVTKSGYGLVRGTNRTENTVAEMTNVPNPDKVADLILTRASLIPKSSTNQ